jgi:hypothetical protein
VKASSGTIVQIAGTTGAIHSAAGIGGGSAAESDAANGGTITITGDHVTADGGTVTAAGCGAVYGAAGIGGGCYSGVQSITITGDDITATGTTFLPAAPSRSTARAP